MVPNGWVTKDLRSISLLITKGSTPTTYGHEFVEQSENSIRFVGAYNCSFDGKFKSDSEKWISKEADELLKRSKLNDKDCIICIVGNTIGSNFLVSKEIIPANINQNVAIIRADERKVNSRYLHYWIMSPYIQYQVQQEASTQAQPSLSLKQVGDFTIALPPINEQNRIAKILSIWDKAISTTEQLLANSQQQKKALMQQLLTGKKRLLDSNGVRFSGEWITIPLEKLCHINPKRPPEPKDGLVSFIPMEFVSEDAKLLSTSERFYTDVSKGFTSFLDGDTLIAKITPCFENGKGCYVQGMKNGVGFGSTEFHVLRANKLSSPLYLYYMTNTSEFRIKGEANMQGSAGQKRVTTDYLKSLKVTVPKQVEEQQKIAVVISTADQGITVLQQKLAALKQEKKALMQQLLTGKRRVKVEEAA